VIDVNYVEQVDSCLSSLVLNDEGIAVIPDLIDEVPDENLHDNKPKCADAKKD